ncbi:twin-arginine translocase TatA/TatE family subunit [Streptomyces fragilis]|uniref:Twin-arginine translocase TatA/TatE family subunit n=1 Tax=Streptomyces fragilis TaxID=67301 RepID=A0ABV2YL89_9ACTN|nr:twin-arginine translocase TatA/TatE family subunit [Streptomyces fragilis]
MLGLSELAVVLVVVIAVLSAKRLPDLVRSAGKSARILKAEARAMKEEEKQDPPVGAEGAESAAPPRTAPAELSTPPPGPAGEPGGAPRQTVRPTPPSAP